MSAAVSSLTTSLKRYGRSLGLWLLLLVAPVSARFWIAADGERGVISAEGRVPVLTSPMLGVSLGIVIATLLLPIAFLYLRANATRRQPWQVEEVSPAWRVPIAYGRWLADVAVLAGVLAATTAAGGVIALFLLPFDQVDLPAIAFTLWVIAFPALAMVASLRVLFDSRPWLRGPLGEVLFVFVWIFSIAIVAASHADSGFAGHMMDMTGFFSPLAHTLPGDDPSFTIGGGALLADKGPIELDVMAGIRAEGYIPSRFAWLGVAALIPLVAGLVYAPHRDKARRRPLIAWAKWLEPGAPPRADPNARPARFAALAWLNLLAAETRLIGGGRRTLLALLAIAAAGWFVPFSTGAGPAAMLVLLFAASAHAGRSEQGGLLALTRTAAVSPWSRRAAFVAACLALALVAAAGGLARAGIDGEMRPFIEALAIGAGTGLTAIGLGALTRSATAPRLVLLIAWYMYLNWGGSAG